MANVIPELSQSEIDSLVAEIQTTLAVVAKNEMERASLRKDEGGGSPAPEEEESAGDPPPPAAEASAPPSDAPPGGAPPGDPAADAGADAPVDPAQLQAAYAQMPVDQLKMHAEAAMAALQQAMGAGDPAQGAPPPAAPPAGPEASASAPDMMGKSLKEITDLKKSLAEQTQITAVLMKGMETILKPVRKAETRLPPKGTIPGVETLSKSEIKEKLTAKVKDRSLTKSDRDLMNDVFLGKDVPTAQIAHLLK